MVCWIVLRTKERVGATAYIVVGVNGASALPWWIRYYFVDWLGNTPLEKKQGEAVVSWVNVLCYVLAYSLTSNDMQPFGACFGVALCWGVVVFLLPSFILFSHSIYPIYLSLLSSLPSIVVQHRPPNKNVHK